MSSPSLNSKPIQWVGKEITINLIILKSLSRVQACPSKRSSRGHNLRREGAVACELPQRKGPSNPNTKNDFPYKDGWIDDGCRGRQTEAKNAAEVEHIGYLPDQRPCRRGTAFTFFSGRDRPIAGQVGHQVSTSNSHTGAS